MNLRKIFHPKGWLVGFAALHTVMFLIPQLFATSTVVEMAWGAGMAPEHAAFYELRLGALGIAYTPMLLAMAYLTEGRTRAKMALVTALSIGAVIVIDVGASIRQAGYLDDMSLLFMIGLPAVIFGGILTSALLHMKEEQ